MKSVFRRPIEVLLYGTEYVYKLKQVRDLMPLASARHLLHAVEPLPTGLCHPVQLDHRSARVFDGRHHPPLVQHDPCPQGPADLDLAGDRVDLYRHHVAVDGAQGPDRRNRSLALDTRKTFVENVHFSAVQDVVQVLLHVPR